MYQQPIQQPVQQQYQAPANPWNTTNQTPLGAVYNSVGAQQQQQQSYVPAPQTTQAQQAQQPAPQQPQAEPTPTEAPKTDTPKTEEQPVVDPTKKEEEKKEVLEDLEDKDESYVQQVVSKILDESIEKDFNLAKLQKESELYKTKYEEMEKELNQYKYDNSKVKVADDYKPLVRSLEQYRATPDDVNAKLKAVTDLYDMIAMLTGENTRQEIQKHYNKMAMAITNMSQPASV